MKRPREQRVTRTIPKGKGQFPGWEEAPAQEVEMTMTPTATKEVPADTQKAGKGTARMEVAEVVEIHQMTRTQGGEMDPIRVSGGDVAPEATQGRRAP